MGDNKLNCYLQILHHESKTENQDLFQVDRCYVVFIPIILSS